MGLKAKIITGISAILALFMVLYSGRIFDLGSMFIPIQMYLAICLSVAISLVFVLRRASKGKPDAPTPWYDYILVVAAIVSIGYVAYNYKDIIDRFSSGYITPFITALFIIASLLILEASRRIMGNVLVIVIALFLLQPYFSNYLPWLLHGRGYPLDRMAFTIFVTPNGIFGMPLQVASTIVFSFLVFGELLFASGAGDVFVRLPMALLGNFRGGPAKISVVASALMGTISGSAVANVVATGTFTIPMMKKIGYNKDFAGAVEAVASTGGIFTPPVMGGIIFVMADWIEVPYAYLCLVAIIPAFLYYFNAFMVLDLEAARTGMKGLPREDLPSVKAVLKDGWIYFLPVVALVFLLAVPQFDAHIAALYSCIVIILISWIKRGGKQIDFLALVYALSRAFKEYLLVGVASAGAGIIMGSLAVSGIGVKFGGAMVSLSGGNLLVLMILAAITAFIMGMGMPQLPIYIILGVMVAPALVNFGIPLVNAHFFIVIMAVLSFITPPVALSVYAACGISGGDIMRTGIQATRLGLCAFILPFWFIYRPSILLQGPLTDTLITVSVAMLSILALSSGLMGYGLKRLSVVERTLLIIAGLLLIIPGTWSDVAGFVLLAALAVEHIMLHKRQLAKATSGDCPPST